MFYGIALSLIGFLHFIFIYRIIIHFLNALYTSQDLNISSIYVIAGRVVSAIQAICACTVGLVTIKECRGDLLRDKHWSIESYALFAVSYFYYDIYAMFNTFWYTTPSVQHLSNRDAIKKFFRKEPLMMLHHILLPPIFFPVIMWYRNGLGDFFLGCLFMFELVIPLISLRSVLKQLKMEDTMLYAVNGVCLIATWILCRIIVFPYMYWEYGRSKDIPFFKVPGEIPLKCNIACLGLMVLQLYWLVFMVRTAVKTIKWKIQRHKEKLENLNTHRNGLHKNMVVNNNNGISSHLLNGKRS